MPKVEVVYITQDAVAVHLNLDLKQVVSVNEALKLSGIFETHPETSELAVGIFSRLVSPDTLLKDGDRIELYRPLLHDPKEKRRSLARNYPKKSL